MTISRVWILDSVNFRVRPIQQLPYQEAATGSFDFEVCIIPRDGKKYSTQVRYQTTHGPVSYNISNFVAPLSTSSVGNAVTDGVEIYPNPTSDIVNVVLGYSFDFSVTNVNGVTVLAGRSEQVVDLKGLPRGSYYLSIKAIGRAEIVKRIVRS
jgi:hypothetical protein